DDQDDEDDGQDECELDVVHRLADRDGAVTADEELHGTGQLRLEFRQKLLDPIDDFDGVRPGLTLDAEVERRLAVVPAGIARVLDAVVDAGYFFQSDRVAIAIRHDDRAVLLGRHQLAAGLHDVVALRAVERAGRAIDVGPVDRARHFVDADLPRRQLRRIQIDAQRVLLRAEYVDLRDAGDHGQALRQHRFGVAIDLRQWQRVRRQRQE